ncbi:MAG TPA: MotA/TolQ/ExbB proton channel family protein [Opitutaceae bacterium]|nr:MotA/TolQ/ExbB proton channel family protein [Opitutaceae bacterium]
MFLAVVSLVRVFNEAGVLAYVLALLSGAAVFIIIERALALRTASVLPPELAEAVLLNKATSGGRYSVLGRVIEFAERHGSDPDATKAYARLEVMKMERGVRYLDTIYTGAPLVGLIGTVYGLLGAFSSTRDQITGLPDPAKFSQSVGYALSATLLGLGVALIALVGNGLIQRRIDHHAAQLDVLLERVIARVRPKSETVKSEDSAAL